MDEWCVLRATLQGRDGELGREALVMTMGLDS